MDQYGIACLAKAYESLPRQLAENSGNDPSKAISKMLAAHAAMEGNMSEGMSRSTLKSSIYYQFIYFTFKSHTQHYSSSSVTTTQLQDLLSNLRKIFNIPRTRAILMNIRAIQEISSI